MIGVLLDLEGTLFVDDQAIPGAVETVQKLRDNGIGLRFLTNIDSLSPAEITRRLAGYGLEIPAEELFTPVSAAQEMFRLLPGAQVLKLLSQEEADEFTELGHTAPFTHVLVGACMGVVNYEMLDEAFRAIRAGAELVALRRGRYFRRGDDEHLDVGAVVAALEYSAGVRARVLGKPSMDFFRMAARSLGVHAEECVVVGDDATTDIAGGRAVGAGTVQVRTGKYAGQLAERLVGGADVTIDSIADLPALVL